MPIASIDSDGQQLLRGGSCLAVGRCDNLNEHVNGEDNVPSLNGGIDVCINGVGDVLGLHGGAVT